MSNKPGHLIPLLQDILYQHFGPLNWWPAESSFEVVIGSVLTQNTAWTNVEKAINNLKKAKVLSAEKIDEMPTERLEQLIRPSGFYRQKAARLQEIAGHIIQQHQGEVASFCLGPLEEARQRLLSISGIGPETADSILLYAANRASFVVDAYTRRIFQRIGILNGNETYEEIRNLFMRHLPEDTQLYNEYHAQIVNLAKAFCKKRQPLCSHCPAEQICRHAQGTQ